ncbi:class I SAM-dependent methyltransferase [Muricauda sp. DJ-13]|uniref:Class I SAM-dependent methyltransferase n=2 Tax=Croceivirga thetidis TaxID=2721623 RepID=A0ABX1GPY2_9FLAO|nr:class I SAM-dependent methyltransferase [Croceivirga thetidis]
MKLLLKKPIFPGISQDELVHQLVGKKKANDKLPTWFSNNHVVYPSKLSMEQTSSETAAMYKSTIVQGDNLIDLTGGFGVDSYLFSSKFKEVLHCELNSELSMVAKHNFDVLGANTIKTIATDGINYLNETEKTFDWVYIDPARRDGNKKKVFLLADYQPNVPKNLKLLFDKTENILIKTSPILDISSGIEELKFVKEVHIVAIKNEVKELLWVLRKDFEGEAIIKTINILPTSNQTFNFHPSSEKKAIAEFSKVQQFLFEPNASILKSGCFKIIGIEFGLKKLSKHTHLYTSEKLVEFPGRIFEVLDVFPFNKKQLKKLNFEKANITIRNFPITVKQLRKEFKIGDGGENYLFFTQDSEGNKIVIWNKKIKSSGINPD